jgi:hypothetical protein
MRIDARIAIAVVAVTAILAGVLITMNVPIAAPLPGPANSREPQPVSSTGQYVFYSHSGHVTQDNGTMTLISANVAEYRSSSGTFMRFNRQASTRSGSLCS